jgi:hypothetical protein
LAPPFDAATRPRLNPRPDLAVAAASAAPIPLPSAA